MTTTPETQSPLTQVLLLNMGGPDTLADIEGYLRRLFSDPDIIRLPLGRGVQERLARFIARRRAPRVRDRYRSIGGGSPLREETRRQAEGLSQRLGLPVRFAMRYSEPFIGPVVREMATGNGTRLVVVPLFPQYSLTTSGSAIRELKAHLADSAGVRIVKDHHDHPAYIDTLVGLLRETAAGLDPARKGHLIFAAHSIPLRYVREGDPYVEQIRATARRIAGTADLGLDWTLAFQSRVGPVRWQGPQLEEILPRLVAMGVRQLVVQPLSFVSENLETLYDLDSVFRERCRAAGIETYLRVPTPGDRPAYLDTLAKLVQETLTEWEGGNG